MNLIQVQDRLNKLPPLPQSIQYLTAAAQGGNPQVPPFMALARISEINKEMQSAQNQSQPPAEPLNQSLPKQALQNMGIGALGQGQPMPQQGMPQGAQPAPQQAPQMPPQQAPQQGAPQQVMTAADGGLMSLPVDDSMFEYGSGGIVAFQSGGLNKTEEAPAEEVAVAEEAPVAEAVDGGADSPVAEEAAVEVEKAEEAVVDAVSEVKEEVAKAVSEINASLTNAFGDLAATIKSLNEQVAAVTKSLDTVTADVNGIKSNFNEFGKRVDLVEQDTAFRKSGDLGEIVQESPQVVQKSLWGGRFLTNTDLFN